jgi:hypothetical protein
MMLLPVDEVAHIVDLLKWLPALVNVELLQ